MINYIFYLLDLHYSAITCIANSVSSSCLSAYHALKTLFITVKSLSVFCWELLFDTVNLLVDLMKFAVWSVIQIWMLLATALHVVDSLIYRVANGVKYAVLVLHTFVTFCMDGLRTVVNFPFYILSSIDSNIFWCYQQVSDAVIRGSHYLTSICSAGLYHCLMSPVYLADYIVRLYEAIGSASSRSVIYICSVCNCVRLMVSDWMAHLYQWSSMTCTSVYTYWSLLLHAYTQLMFTMSESYKTQGNVFYQACLSSLVTPARQTSQIQDLLADVLRLPFLLLATTIDDLMEYVVRAQLQINYLIYGSSSLPPCISSPLPSVQRDLYCLFEALALTVISVVRANVALILVWTVFAVSLYISVTRRADIIVRRQLAHQAEAFVDMDAAQADTAGDSDSSDTELSALTRTPRSHHMERRSRSHTPDLSIPGAETKYIRHLRTRLDEERDRQVCAVCQVDVRTVLLLPCKHVCVCNTCVTQILRREPRTCPLCRSDITEVMNVYL